LIVHTLRERSRKVELRKGQRYSNEFRRQAVERVNVGRDQYSACVIEQGSETQGIKGKQLKNISEYSKVQVKSIEALEADACCVHRVAVV
jgi:hypothetical protein